LNVNEHEFEEHSLILLDKVLLLVEYVYIQPINIETKDDNVLIEKKNSIWNQYFIHKG